MASGGPDGTLRLWSLELEERLGIDIGQRINPVVWIHAETVSVATDRGVVAVRVRCGMAAKGS